MGNIAPNRPLRVLIVRVGAMGDVLHALPAVSALRAQLPDTFIGWAIEPAWRSLVENTAGSMPLVDRIHSVSTRAWKQRPFSLETIRNIVELRRGMREARYDVCIDLQGSIRSAVIGRLSGASRFVGPEDPRERQARLLYRERLAIQAPHVIDQAGELLGGALKIALAPARVILPFEPEVDSTLQQGFVLLAPTAGWGAKMWPVERYRELAAKLRSAGYRVLVNASSREDAVAGQVEAKLFVCGVAELPALIRNAALVIGGDTGPVQMAGALGVPAVALFGPTDPARTGPDRFPGSRVTILRDPSSTVDHRRHAETEAGLRRISVEAVFAAALKMLTDSPAARGAVTWPSAGPS